MTGEGDAFSVDIDSGKVNLGVQGLPLRPAPAPAAGRRPGAHVADLARGQDLYTTTCAVCHGPTGLGGAHGGAKLTRALTHDGVASVLSKGRN
jgi:mono/diheme cytochrome c family protein